MKEQAKSLLSQLMVHARRWNTLSELRIVRGLILGVGGVLIVALAFGPPFWFALAAVLALILVVHFIRRAMRIDRPPDQT